MWREQKIRYTIISLLINLINKSQDVFTENRGVSSFGKFHYRYTWKSCFKKFNMWSVVERTGSVDLYQEIFFLKFTQKFTYTVLKVILVQYITIKCATYSYFMYNLSVMIIIIQLILFFCITFRLFALQWL